MDRKEKEHIRTSRDKAITFVKAEMAGKKGAYACFVKDMEDTSLESGAPGMEKLCNLMWRCIPKDCKELLDSFVKIFTGDMDANFPEDDRTSPYDQYLTAFTNGKTIAVRYDGDISITDKQQKSSDGLCLSMNEYERLKGCFPPIMKQTMLDSLSFMFDEEEDKNTFLSSLNDVGMLMYLVSGMNVPKMLCNLQKAVCEEKDETAIFTYYYILEDKGFQKTARLLPSILLTGAAGYPGLDMFRGIIQQFVSTSTSMGIDDKSSWKEVMDGTDSDELWKEIASALRHAEDNHGMKKKIESLEDMLKNDAHGEILSTIEHFTKEQKEPISIAYLLIALEKTGCMKRHYPFSTFVDAVNRRFGKEYSYQSAQRRYSAISSTPSMLNEKKASMREAKKIIEKWKEEFLKCNLVE